MACICLITNIGHADTEIYIDQFWLSSESLGIHATGVAPGTTVVVEATTDIATGVWQTVYIYPDNRTPSFLYNHSAIWDGSGMIVVGVVDGTGNNGLSVRRYDDNQATWNTLVTNALPTRFSQSTVWDDSEVIIFGGYGYGYGFANACLNTGMKYCLSNNTLSGISTSSAPFARQNHSAVWDGQTMIVWGGQNTAYGYGYGYLNDGARYSPATDTWYPISSTGAPSPRSRHTAIWDGNKMIIWGGFGWTYGYGYGYGFNTFNDGGMYDPASDSWQLFTAPIDVAPRARHSAVWDGSSMIIWGGQGADGRGRQDGYRLDPNMFVWCPIATNNAPSARWDHSAIFNGSEMMVFGGYGYGFGALGDGGQYSPAHNSWADHSFNSMTFGYGYGFGVGNVPVTNYVESAYTNEHGYGYAYIPEYGYTNGFGFQPVVSWTSPLNVFQKQVYYRLRQQ
jgi:hypothetical protein